MNGKRTSFKRRLIVAMLLTAAIPMLFIAVAFYSNNVAIVRNNMDQLAELSLQKTKSNVDAWLSSYEELLYQISTSDEIVDWADEINRQENVELAKKAVHAKLQELFYSRSYIKSITLIPESGSMVFYDQFTTVASKNSWIDTMGISERALYNQIASEGGISFFATRYATDFGGKPQYLFHFGRRLVDYLDVRKQSGVVILSIDVALLQSLCDSADSTDGSYQFMLDGEGRLLSFSDLTQVGRQVAGAEQTVEERKAAALAFVNEQFGKRPYVSAYIAHDDYFGWDIIGVSDQSNAILRLQTQRNLFLVLILFAFTLTIGFTLLELRQLMNTVRIMSDAFERLGQGDLSTRVSAGESIPVEMDTILSQYNDMLDRLKASIDREKEAEKRSRSAQIAALEAQINPHFLNNTLDTINWMAIQHDEREISDAISALGQILRYGIVDNDQSVPVEQELEWLQKYVLLQKIRLKGTFTCEINVDPAVRGLMLHKLVLQPFVENAIIHGFVRLRRNGILKVTIREEKETLAILISDNGRGIPQETVTAINSGDLAYLEADRHLGMKNAISRLQMYYGEKASVWVESKNGTTILIRIPMEKLERST